MSIRIHALAKELNVQSKELIDFINQRQDIYHLDIKTPSNAIDPFTAEAIGKDFAANAAGETKTPDTPAEAAATTESTVAEIAANNQAQASENHEQQSAPEKTPEAPQVAVAPKVPEPIAAQPAGKKPAPMVPPKAAPRPKIAMPEVKPQVAPKREVQPEVVIKFAQKPAQPTAPRVTSQQSKTAPSVPPMPAQARVPAPAVPPMTAKPAPMVPPSASKAAPAVPQMSSGKAAPMVPTMPTSKAAPALPPMTGKAAAPMVPPTAQAQQSAVKKDFKTIQLKAPIIVRDFAKSIDLKPFRLISELMDMGIFASMNQSIEDPTAIVIAKKHGFDLDIRHRGEQQQPKKKEVAKKPEDDIKNYVPRPPIVCILGHVDHGKTTLLDTIRNTNVVAGEAGGITQHTAAYQVSCNGKKITFLDTPGHAAFSKMRERGANVTDIAILVVAADDGFMPQTDEALSFAQKAGVPIVVAINKMDAKGANIDRVKQQMQKRGITSEDWGGEVLCTPVSALKATNIDKLLELVLLQAEIMELKANPKAPVEGVIIESQIEQGRGATSTVIVRQGTLKAGDVVVCGENWCKVRALMNDKGASIKEATPSTPALVMGWTGTPEAGDSFEKVANDRAAKEIAEEAIRQRKLAASAEVEPQPASIEKLMAAIQNKDHKVYKCIVKSDVSGTVEALVACLKDIKSDKVGLEVIGDSVGQITKNDIEFAATAGAAIVAFNVKQENGVAGLAKHMGVEIVSHNIIYELINTVKDAMKNLLDPELRENKLGAAEVRQLFNVSKGGKVAGCMVIEGLVKNGKFARVFRKNKEISSRGRISEIKRFKDDVAEVRAGYECGITLNNFSDFETGDIIECFEILEIRPEL